MCTAFSGTKVRVPIFNNMKSNGITFRTITLHSVNNLAENIFVRIYLFVSIKSTNVKLIIRHRRRGSQNSLQNASKILRNLRYYSTKWRPRHQVTNNKKTGRVCQRRDCLLYKY